MKIGFYFKADDLKRWQRAVQNLLKEAQLSDKKLPYEGAVAYRNLVLQNLSHQRYGWTRLSQSYAEWKAKHGYPAKFWMMRGELIAAIRVFRARGYKGKMGWAGGVDPNVYAPKIGWSNKPRGNIKVIKYAIYDEEGTPTQPPRPLFMPTANDYADRLWPVLGAKHHNRLRGVWR